MTIRIFRSILIALLVAAAGHLPAATFVVSDLGNSGPGTLRQAILDANTVPGDDTITFSVSGTIILAADLPAITENTIIIGPGTDALTLSGNKACRGFSLTSGTTNQISGLTIADVRTVNYWSVTNQNPSYINGAGISNAGCLKLVNCTIRDGVGSYTLGTGIYNAGVLELDKCTITNSTSTGGDTPVRGGGVYNSGVMLVKNSRIVKCYSQGSGSAPGGGFYNTGSMLLTNTVVSQCSGSFYGDGAGIRNYGTAALIGCVISGCNGSYGGGIESSGNLALTNTTVSGNRGDKGGGLLLYETNILVGCSIYSNDGGAQGGGGGILNYGETKLYNCTISQNAVYISLPGTGIAHNGGSLYLNHCTIVSNYVYQSGVAQELVATAGITAENSLLADCKGTLYSGGHNLIVKTNGCTVTGTTTGNLLAVNPNLGPLQNNGGPTLTIALLPGSPAIDQADAGGLPTDQRGFLRPVAPLAADIGAFEAVVIQPPILSITLTPPGQVTLSWATGPAPFVLQANPGLANNGWADVNASPSDDGTTTHVILPVNGDGKFYRLRSP